MDLRMDGDYGLPHQWAHWFAMTGFAWDAVWAGTLELHLKKASPHRHVYRRGDLQFYSYED